MISRQEMTIAKCLNHLISSLILQHG